MISYLNYKQQFTTILEGNSQDTVYQNAAYVEYVKLNQSRMKRWEKTGQLSDETLRSLLSIEKPIQWVVISEPWCGDAAHILPFISKMAAVTPLIELKIQNRDSGSEIENYLTNGGKSIPIVICRNELNQDLFVWGPRPSGAQQLFLAHKEDESLSAEQKKEALQQWYNENKGLQIQNEITELLVTRFLGRDHEALK